MKTGMVVLVGLFLLGVVGYLATFVWRLIRGERLEEKAEPRASSKLGVFLLSGFVALAIAGFLLGRGAPEYSLTAQQLYSAFSDNELAAHAKYVGKRVELAGKFSEGGVSLTGPWLLLDVSSFFGAIQCNLESDQAARAGKLGMGQSIRVTGEVLGKEKNVVLQDCVIES